MLFALSVFILQTQRPMLPRAMRTNPLIPFLAAALVFLALYGALISHREVIPVFLSFWMTLAFVVALFGARLKLLKGVEKLLGLPLCVPRIAAAISRLVTRVQQESSVVYFTKSGNLCRLNKALLYVKRNEDTNHCRIVHLWEDASSVPRHLVHMGQILDAMYPSVRIDTVFVKGKFGPAVIDQLSREWNVPTNLMFITCPTSTDAGKRLKDLHGVRVIMSHEDELVEENQPRDTSVGLRSQSGTYDLRGFRHAERKNWLRTRRRGSFIWSVWAGHLPNFGRLFPGCFDADFSSQPNSHFPSFEVYKI